MAIRTAQSAAPLDLGEILARALDVAGGPVRRDAEAVDADARWPEAGLRALQDAGLGGLVVSEASGGLGQGMFALAQVCEILGRECASTAICFGMHCVGAAVIAANATGDQEERYLRPIADGRHLTTLALSEPGTGSHFYIPEARLDEAPSEAYRVTGTKTFVTNGGHADSYVVSVVAGGADAPGQFSCLVVPAGADGIRWGEPWRGVGMRGNSSRTMELDGVTVSRRELLGQEGDELWYLFNVIAPYFLVAMAGTYLGVAEAALGEAREHVAGRRHAHTGEALAQQPVLQHRIGTLWGMVERTRRLVYYASAQGDVSGPDALPAILSAKAEVADSAVAVANEAMTLAGGIAYRENSTLHRHLRDARASHVMAPTTDILRTWTGRAVLDQPLLGE